MVVARLTIAALAAVLAGCAATPSPSAERSRAQRDAFQRAHPCPANDATRGACPGYVVDHIIPLCAGGADRPGNMQWQTVADAKAKDQLEFAQCRTRRRNKTESMLAL